MSYYTSPLLTETTTHHGPSAITRSGEYFPLNGAYVLIVSDTGRAAMLRVNDSGYLTNAGLFRRSKVSDYFLPVSSPVGFGRVYPVAIDLPRQAFQRIFGNTRTRLVYVWVIR